MHTDILQPFLGVDKHNPIFNILFKVDTPDELLVHFGLELLETVQRGSFLEKLLIARLYNANVNRRVLTEKFKYSRKTIQNWAELLKSGKPAELLKIAEGRGISKKVTDDRLQYIEYLFDQHYEEQGCHINSFIRDKYIEVYREPVSNETIRLILFEKRKKLKEAQKCPDPASASESETDAAVTFYSPAAASLEEYPKNNNADFSAEQEPASEQDSAKVRENTWRNPDSSHSNFEKKSKCSPSEAVLCTNNFPLVDNKFSRILSCYHIGILISRIFLDFISEGMGDISDIVRQWSAMILDGCQNIEQGQRLSYRALELLIGKQKTSANKQRDELKLVATKENVNLVFTQNIRMIKAENDDTFLIDPHGVPYTGQLPVPKCWLGASHTIGKGYYLDLIHTLKGEPVFSVINDNYYDLRQRFLADISEFRKILGGNQDRILTMVVDRAIYDVQFMKKVRSENLHIITWEKNYKKGQWKSKSEYPVKTFSILKYRNRKEDTYTYTVQYFKRAWIKEENFAQYIILLSKPGREPVELSVICTDYMRNAEEAITPILTRWTQENDMGYLINLGINQITSYKYESYEEIGETLKDRQIENRDYTKLAAERLKIKKALGTLLVNREFYIEKKEQNLADMQNKAQDYEKRLSTEKMTDSQKSNLELKLRKIKSKIKRLPKDKEKALNKNQQKQEIIRTRIKEFNERIPDIPHKISRLEKMIKEEYVRLNFMPKAFMDAVKITARNIIYQLLDIFRPIWNNRRNDLIILRELISSMGHIEENEKNIIIRINPARQFTQKEKQNILLFLFQISNLVNKKYKLEKIVVFSMYDL